MYTDPSSLPVFLSQAHSLMPLLFWQRNDRPSIPREYTTLSSFPIFSPFVSYSCRSLFGIQQVSSSNVAHFLPNTRTHARAHTHTSARLVSSTLSPSSLTYFFLAFFYSRFGQPHSQRIPFSLPPSISAVAYVPISISIIAGELPASLGASQGCGLQNGFPEILPLPVTSSSWCLFGCLAVSNDLSLFIDRRHSLSLSLSLFHSRFPMPPSLRLPPLVLSYSGFLASEIRLHAHSRFAGTS